MLEWYRKDTDYKTLMHDCEQLLRFLCTTLTSHKFPLDVEQPWEYLTVAEAFTQHSSMSVRESLQKDCFDELLVEDVEPQLGIKRPTFLYDYPLELASLARQKREEPELAERFELYVTGVELANGFSELTDSQIQRERFLAEYSAMGSTNKKMPEQFLTALGQLDEAAGIALGLDRLLMLFTGSNSLQEIVSFTPEEYDM